MTVPGNPITTGLWAPVMDCVITPHIIYSPGMPYHNLGKAHHRLMKALPEDSIYRLTLRESLWHGLVYIWNETTETQKKKK